MLLQSEGRKAKALRHLHLGKEKPSSKLTLPHPGPAPDSTQPTVDSGAGAGGGSESPCLTWEGLSDHPMPLILALPTRHRQSRWGTARVKGKL